MQIEVLRFLLTAREYLRDGGAVRNDAGAFEDLQAVDRSLPDCDWFELEEIFSPGRRTGGRRAAFELQFDS